MSINAGTSLRLSTPPRLALLAALVVVLALAALVGLWLLRHHRIEWSIQRGMQHFAAAQSPADVMTQLDVWERETRPYWESRESTLIERLFSKHDVADPAIRAMLERVSGVFYGDRVEDWQRWYENQQRIAAGRQPETPRRQEIEIEPLWDTPVGLTAWFSTMLPFGDQIFVASLGATLDDADDEWDGIVQVAGRTGETTLIFTPPDRAPRDILGLSVGNGVLYAACRNGFVYEVSPLGNLLRRFYAAGEITSVPLTIDLNENGTADVVVVTRDGKVVAFSGESGSTPWVRHLPGGQPGLAGSPTLVQATLAAGDVHSRGGPEIVVVTQAGELYVLSARDGRILWQHGLAAGSLAAPLAFNDAGENRAPLFTADGRGRLWAAVTSADSFTPQLLLTATQREATGVIAALRTLDNGSNVAPWLVICPTGRMSGPAGSVAAVGQTGLQWRYRVPGAVWAAPAIGDINADEESELIVASLVREPEGPTTGRLTFLSRNGHCLRWLRLNAPIEAPPVLADVNGDARMELLVADQAGYLRCYALRGRRQIEWGVANGDSHNSQNALNAYAWGQHPAELRWQWQPNY